jgi:hypothetical protein
MPTTHPLADDSVGGTPPAAVTVGSETYAVAADGTIACPADAAATLESAWADRYDWYDDAITVTGGDTCRVEKADGEVCGRDLPCQYHSDTDEDT